MSIKLKLYVHKTKSVLREPKLCRENKIYAQKTKVLPIKHNTKTTIQNY